MIVLAATNHKEPSDYLMTLGLPIDTAAGFGGDVVGAYQFLYESRKAEDVLAFVHDDVEMFDPDWREKVALELMDPQVAIVGLGGATGIGVPDIYKTPYQIEQLIRNNYCSNQKGWEIHGTQEEGSKDVAVVDGFFMAVKTKFLKEVDGWKQVKTRFHMYDVGLCLLALRHGYKVRMLGLECDHHGGGSSTKAEYFNWCKENGTSMEREHWEPHLWVYEEFRDLLPLRVL